MKKSFYVELHEVTIKNHELCESVIPGTKFSSIESAKKKADELEKVWREDGLVSENFVGISFFVEDDPDLVEDAYDLGDVKE